MAGAIGLAVITTLIAISLFGGRTDPSAAASDAASPSAPVSASALPTRSQSSGASPTDPSPSQGTPAPTPTASGEASAFARPRDVLPVLAEVRVTADGLRLRRGPGTTYDVVATVNEGDLLYVTRGSSPDLAPRRADGFEWYGVQYAPGYGGWPVEPEMEDRVEGYIAARSTSEAFLELVAPECPDQVTDLASVVSMTPYERVACLGDRELTLEGTFGCPFCDSLLYPWSTEPAWLATWQIHLDMLVPSWSPYPPFPGSIELAVPPDGVDLGPDQRGAIVRVTGHFDDPRSVDCTITPGASAGTIEPVHDEAAEWYCRERFVVESWEVIGTDPAFEPLVPR